MLKILTIGDIHGKNVWKKFEDIPQLLTYVGFEPDYDYYVFMGDYTDAFDKTNVEILHNLKEIIEFKKNYPQNVVLLIGNHDVPYMMGYERKYWCTGHRSEATFDLNLLFKENRELFQLAFQYENYLWTHAGVHRGWYTYTFLKQNKPFIDGLATVADNLNHAFDYRLDCIFDVGMKRGGYKQVGGPLWADKMETWYKPLNNYHQIVGHTRVNKIVERKINKNTSVTYIDCLDNGAEPHILIFN
jgi:predicted MPP superfamily phosphohydrolase